MGWKASAVKKRLMGWESSAGKKQLMGWESSAGTDTGDLSQFTICEFN